MSDNKDYSNLTLEELLIEEKKIKKKELTTAVLIGFLVGIMIYAIVKNGIELLSIGLPLILISGIYKYSQKDKDRLKHIRAAINIQGTTE